MANLAFFDVDDTLTLNGMESFLHSYRPKLINQGAFGQRVRALLELQSSGANRDVISTEYFRLFAGESWVHLLSEGRRWAAEQEATGILFTPSVHAALIAHRAAGDRVIFVSGSFEPLLAPIADMVGASWVACSTIEREGDVLTGATTEALIGDSKGTTVRDAQAELGIPSERCFGYGDHISDLPLLEAVGHPVVVVGEATSAELVEIAATRGWATLPR